MARWFHLFHYQKVVSMLLQVHLPFLTFSMYPRQSKLSKILSHWLFETGTPYRDLWLKKNLNMGWVPRRFSKNSVWPSFGWSEYEIEQVAQMARNINVWYLFMSTATSIQPQDFIHSLKKQVLTDCLSVPDTGNRRSKRHSSCSQVHSTYYADTLKRIDSKNPTWARSTAWLSKTTRGQSGWTSWRRQQYWVCRIHRNYHIWN